jgi:hypothetical protein
MSSLGDATSLLGDTKSSLVSQFKGHSLPVLRRGQHSRSSLRSASPHTGVQLAFAPVAEPPTTVALGLAPTNTTTRPRVDRLPQVRSQSSYAYAPPSC